VVAAIILAIANLPDGVQNELAKMMDKVSVYLGKFSTMLDKLDGAAIYAKIKEIFTGAIDTIVGFFTGAETTDKLNGSVATLGDKIGGVFKSAFGLAKEFAKPAMEDLMTGLDNTLSGQSKTGSAVAVGLAAYLGGPLALLAAPAALGTIPEDVRKNILSSFDAAPDLGATFAGWTSSFGTKIREFVAGIPKMLLDAVSKFDALTTSGGSFLGDLADKITSAIQSFDLSGVIQSFFDGLFGPKATNAASNIDWSSILESIMTGLFSVAKAIWYVIKFVGEIAVTLGIELFKALYTIQKNITEGVLGIINDALKYMINETINGVKSLLNLVIDGLNFVREKAGLDKIAKFDMTPTFNEKKAEDTGHKMVAAVNKGASAYSPKKENGMQKSFGESMPTPVAMPTATPTDPAKLNAMANQMFGSGERIMGAQAEGMKAGAPAVVASMTEAQRLTMSLMPQRGIPIAATVPFAKLPDSGKLIMEMIAQGMSSGISSLTTQAASAFVAITGEFQNGSLTLKNDMDAIFLNIGTSASDMFTKGVLTGNAAKIDDISQALGSAWGSAIANIKIVDTSVTESTAVLDLNSITAITTSIKDMSKAVVAELVKVTYNTGKTAEFTAKTAQVQFINIYAQPVVRRQ
jgi:hypothetical protein